MEDIKVKVNQMHLMWKIRNRFHLIRLTNLMHHVLHNKEYSWPMNKIDKKFEFNLKKNLTCKISA